MTADRGSFHDRYVSLIRGIERDFPVSQWRLDDVAVWPLARFDLYVEMHRSHFVQRQPSPGPLLLRLAAALARPLLYHWRAARRDRAHRILRPAPAYAALLGDGVSLDRIDGAYRDRFGAPLIAALERQGRATFLMQHGDLSRLPWQRPTYPVYGIACRSAWFGRLGQGGAVRLPGHADVAAYAACRNAGTQVLARDSLVRRARRMAIAASLFERLLRRVRPRLGFVVNHAAGLGPAFLVACRRQAILSVDLQRCPYEGAPMAYGWPAIPDEGYATLPAIFWSWSESSSPVAPSPWHRQLHGGHVQLSSFLNDGSAAARGWDRKFRAFAGPPVAREILVALQPIGGQRTHWDALAAAIEKSPQNWRWWIRRHPTMRGDQDAAFGRLLGLRRSNVAIDPPLPLPALLRHMHALVSLASGAAVEASFFGVPAFFLSPEAAGPFHGLIGRGGARIVSVSGLTDEIARLADRPPIHRRDWTPSLDWSLARLDAMAADYAARLRGRAP